MWRHLSTYVHLCNKDSVTLSLLINFLTFYAMLRTFLKKNLEKSSKYVRNLVSFFAFSTLSVTLSDRLESALLHFASSVFLREHLLGLTLLIKDYAIFGKIWPKTIILPQIMKARSNLSDLAKSSVKV